MKIAIPTNDGYTISPHFGRSAGFLIVETEDGRIVSAELRRNTMEHSHEAGHGHGQEPCANHEAAHGHAHEPCSNHEAGGHAHGHASLTTLLADCETVLCAGMGMRAAEALKQAGVSHIAVTSPGSIEEKVLSLLAGTLDTSGGSFCRCSH
jgi:predicted Fe-Mo cluster-binding NifX family protein